jgi:hypothetical protein
MELWITHKACSSGAVQSPRGSHTTTLRFSTCAAFQVALPSRSVWGISEGTGSIRAAHRSRGARLEGALCEYLNSRGYENRQAWPGAGSR